MLVGAGQSTHEMEQDFENIVIKALKLGLQLQLQQMISSESNLIKILTHKSSQDGTDNNFATSFVPQHNENGFILDKLKKFCFVLAAKASPTKNQPPVNDNQEQTIAPAPLSTDLMKKQMESAIVASVQDVMEKVIKQGQLVQSPRPGPQKNNEKRDHDQDSLAVALMDVSVPVAHQQDPNLSWDVNMKRDLHNESNLILEEF